MFFSVIIFRTSSLGDSISSDPGRTSLGMGLGVGGVRLYRSLQWEGRGCWKVGRWRGCGRAASLNIRRLLLRKTRYLKLRNLVLFYVWEDG